LVGTIGTTLSSINTTVRAISASTVEIQTVLGNFTGTVTGSSNGVSTIATGIGDLLVSTSAIQGNTSSAQTSTNWVLILVIITMALAAAAVGLSAVAVSRAGRRERPPEVWKGGPLPPEPPTPPT
ncbi:MAG: hypothetical protein ACREB9_07255, partial [Thermoplasmata archaeon]